MNKRILALIALSSIVMTGLKLSAMEDPVEKQGITQLESEIRAVKCRIGKLIKRSDLYLQEQAEGREDYNTRVALQSTTDLIQEERDLCRRLQEEHAKITSS